MITRTTCYVCGVVRNPETIGMNKQIGMSQIYSQNIQRDNKPFRSDIGIEEHIASYMLWKTWQETFKPKELTNTVMPPNTPTMVPQEV